MATLTVASASICKKISNLFIVDSPTPIQTCFPKHHKLHKPYKLYTNSLSFISSVPSLSYTPAAFDGFELKEDIGITEQENPDAELLEDQDEEGEEKQVEEPNVSGSIDEAGRLYVGNLPYSMTSSQLTEVFGEAGNVVSVEVIYDRVTNRSRGFAFVTMGSIEEAKEAVRKFDDSARILLEHEYVADGENPQQLYEENPVSGADGIQPLEIIPDADTSFEEGCRGQGQSSMSREEYFRVLDVLKAENSDKETNIPDGNTSCLATCTTSDIEDDPFKGSYYYEAEGIGDDRQGALTSCVGTRWFRAPELLYGSTNYGLEIDLWSLGCIFAELFTLQPLFPGTSDIDQLSRIISVLGDLTEEVWPDSAKLPDYKTISFIKNENPTGLETCLPGHSPNEISIIKRLVCYNPASRAAAVELLNDRYFTEEPLPVPLSELHVCLTRNGQDEDSPHRYYDYDEMDSDSDLDFGPMNVKTTDSGFSIQFP